MSESVVVSPAKVRAARLLVRLSDEDGSQVDDAVRAIANATNAPAEPAGEPNTALLSSPGPVFAPATEVPSGDRVRAATVEEEQALLDLVDANHDEDGSAVPSLDAHRWVVFMPVDGDARTSPEDARSPSERRADHEEALRSLEQRAKAGDATAMTRLGALLLNLTPPDTEGALRWLKRAVEIDTAGGRVQP